MFSTWIWLKYSYKKIHMYDIMKILMKPSGMVRRVWILLSPTCSYSKQLHEYWTTWSQQLQIKVKLVPTEKFEQAFLLIKSYANLLFSIECLFTIEDINDFLQ